MRYFLFSLFILSFNFSFLMAFDAPQAQSSLGRVRYVEGDSATFIYEDQKFPIELDFLVFPDVPYETGTSRVELVDRISNTFWFDQHTEVGFVKGSWLNHNTKVALLKGTIICETERVCQIETQLGLVKLPAKGKYLLKIAPDSDLATVATLEGKPAEILEDKTAKGSTKAVEPWIDGFTEWQNHRIRDWNTTILRATAAHDMTNMHPYMAYTTAEGELQWKTVEHALFNFLASDAMHGYKYDYDVIRMYLANLRSEKPVRLKLEMDKSWFLANHIDGVIWEWSVEKGWFPIFSYEKGFKKPNVERSGPPVMSAFSQPVDPGGQSSQSFGSNQSGPQQGGNHGMSGGSTSSGSVKGDVDPDSP